MSLVGPNGQPLMMPPPQLVRLELYTKEGDQLVGVSMNMSIPMPSTLIQLVGQTSFSHGGMAARLFRVLQTVTICLDQTKGFPDMGSATVKVIVEPVGPARSIEPDMLRVEHPAPFTADQMKDIERELYGKSDDPPA